MRRGKEKIGESRREPKVARKIERDRERGSETVIAKERERNKGGRRI